MSSYNNRLIHLNNFANEISEKSEEKNLSFKNNEFSSKEELNNEDYYENFYN